MKKLLILCALLLAALLSGYAAEPSQGQTAGNTSKAPTPQEETPASFESVSTEPSAPTEIPTEADNPAACVLNEDKHDSGPAVSSEPVSTPTESNAPASEEAKQPPVLPEKPEKAESPKEEPSVPAITEPEPTPETEPAFDMQYGYQGNLSTSWRSQNDSDADKLAHAFATQLLVWETVVGERDADFDHVSTGGYDAILSLVSPYHPLYSRIMDYYDSIEYSVQSHAVCPSFMSRSSGGAKTIELAWDGSQYIAELTDTNRVLSQFTFSASETGFHFSVSGNTLTITTDTAPGGNVTISATRSASRCGVLVWTDYKYGPNGGVQDTITYTASVSDPVKAFVKLKVSYGGAKIIKTSEDSKVEGITFTITGEGVNQSVTTDRNGEIRMEKQKLRRHPMLFSGHPCTRPFAVSRMRRKPL